MASNHNKGVFYNTRVFFKNVIEVSSEFSRNAFRFVPGIGPIEYQNDKCLTGRVAIITGANTGLGKETAKQFAKRKAKVIMACRDLEKANTAMQEIKAQLPDSDLTVKKLDLSSLQSVREFVKDINESQESIKAIDYLINNAGVAGCPKKTTSDGFELHFGTNHLGHFALTLLLLDKLKSSPQARVINVSALGHKVGKIDFDDLNLDKPNAYRPLRAYVQSKLANVLFARELARRLKDTNVIAFSLHPGVVETDIFRHSSETTSANVMDKLMYPFKLSPFLGAQTTMYCALEDSIVSSSGSYFSNCTQVELTKDACDDDLAKKLWDVSCDLVAMPEGKDI